MLGQVDRRRAIDRQVEDVALAVEAGGVQDAAAVGQPAVDGFADVRGMGQVGLPAASTSTPPES